MKEKNFPSTYSIFGRGGVYPCAFLLHQREGKQLCLPDGKKKKVEKKGEDKGRSK